MNQLNEHALTLNALSWHGCHENMADTFCKNSVEQCMSQRCMMGREKGGTKLGISLVVSHVTRGGYCCCASSNVSTPNERQQ